MRCPGQHEDCSVCLQCGACRPGLPPFLQNVLEFNRIGSGYVQIEGPGVPA